MTTGALNGLAKPTGAIGGGAGPGFDLAMGALNGAVSKLSGAPGSGGGGGLPGLDLAMGALNGLVSGSGSGSATAHTNTLGGPGGQSDLTQKGSPDTAYPKTHHPNPEKNTHGASWPSGSGSLNYDQTQKQPTPPGGSGGGILGGGLHMQRRAGWYADVDLEGMGVVWGREAEAEADPEAEFWFEEFEMDM